MPAAVSQTASTALSAAADATDSANAGIRQEPELPVHEAVDPPPRAPVPEFEDTDSDDQDAVRARTLQGRVRANARQASMDPDDGIAL